MSDLTAHVPPSSASSELRPIVGVGGYLRLAEQLDLAVNEFDNGRLGAADRRAAARASNERAFRRCRDLFGVGALVLGLAGTSLVLGETLSAVAWSLAVLAPALMFGAKTWPVSTRLRLIDIEGANAVSELHVVKARQVWLQRAARIVCVLKSNLGTESSEDIDDVIKRALRAERKLKARLASPRYSQLSVSASGWSEGMDVVRKGLGAGVVAGAVNSIGFGVAGRPTPAIVCGLAASICSALRWVGASVYVERRARVVSKLSIWNKQRDMLADVDKQIRNEADTLVSRYQQRVVVDLRES